MNKSKLKNFVKRCIAEVVVEGNVENPIALKTKHIIYGELERMGFQQESSGYMGYDNDENGIYCLVDTRNNVVKIESSYYDEDNDRYELDIDQSLPIPNLYDDEPDMKFINAIINFYRKKIPKFNKTKNLGEGNYDQLGFHAPNNLHTFLRQMGYRWNENNATYTSEDKGDITIHQDATSTLTLGSRTFHFMNLNDLADFVGHEINNINNEPDQTGSYTIEEAGEQKPEKISNGERNKLGKEFAKLGLDGNGRFVKKEYGLRAVTSVLDSLGFQLDMVTLDTIMGDKGSRNFVYRRKNDEGQDPFSEKPEIINSRIVFTWELLAPDKFEVLVYAS